MNSTILRANILGGMDSYICSCGDEEIWEVWIMGGVPDESSEEDLMSLAEDEIVFLEICELFGKLCKEIKKDLDI